MQTLGSPSSTCFPWQPLYSRTRDANPDHSHIANAPMEERGILLPEQLEGNRLCLKQEPFECISGWVLEAQGNLWQGEGASLY